MIKCYRCTGVTTATMELQKRFSNGVQEHLCTVCGEESNEVIRNIREVYGMNNPQWKKVLRRFRKKNGIPLYGNLNAFNDNLVRKKNEALMRLMLIMDIRAIRLWLGK